MNNFNKLNLKEEILEALELLGYTSMTDVQNETIPKILNKKDIVVKSQTGSGKTAAFGIPICNVVRWDDRAPQALVITPTRELAMQIREELFNIGRFRRLSVVEVMGSTSFYNQERLLKQKTHIVVGTPGRIKDHLEKGNMDTSNIDYLVLDESDEMLNMGFLDDVEDIISYLPEDRNTLLFSATMPEDIEALYHRYMNNPEYIEIKSEDATLDRIIQEKYLLDKEDKLDLLKDVTIVENPEKCIIFCNTRDEVDRVHDNLEEEGYSCDRIHGGMMQDQRTRIMEDFKVGYARYLIATDVAARGIDVDNISLVINYDVPEEVESHIHRIGRTARIGNRGKAITLYKSHERRYLRAIEKHMGEEIRLVDKPTINDIEENKVAFKERMKEPLKILESKGEELSKDILKIHINAGNKTRMRAGDIVGGLCSIDGIVAEDIGVINIIDTSTFVEILNGKGEIVLEALKTTPIKGRLRIASKANS